jgi:hypothetical protein
LLDQSFGTLPCHAEKPTNGCSGDNGNWLRDTAKPALGNVVPEPIGGGGAYSEFQASL